MGTRTAAALVSVALAAGWSVVAAPAAWATTSPCDGSMPALNSTVTCATASYTSVPVPFGAEAVDVHLIGGGGAGANTVGGYRGGDAGEVSGIVDLPTGASYLAVDVAYGGDAAGGTAPGRGGGASCWARQALRASRS